jgi:hypothetical protein
MSPSTRRNMNDNDKQSLFFFDRKKRLVKITIIDSFQIICLITKNIVNYDKLLAI